MDMGGGGVKPGADARVGQARAQHRRVHLRLSLLRVRAAGIRTLDIHFGDVYLYLG